MSWQLLVPIVEKLVSAGIDYYNSDSTTKELVPVSDQDNKEPVPETKDLVLIASLKVNPSISLEDLKPKLQEALATLEGVEGVLLEVDNG